MKIKTTIPGLVLLTTVSCSSRAQQFIPEVKIVGQMKNVMWKGQLYGNISLDTISIKEHLYGMGPVEYLAGEILIIDGRSYRSTVLTDQAMYVEETYTLKAPFFGYAYIRNWTEQALPDSVRTIPELEVFLDQVTKSFPRPFLFKLGGTVEEATIHVVNLPKGATVSSPDEAHRGQKNYSLANEQVEIIGFFSTRHQAIFTHHNSFLHMHLITANREKMGHLDQALFKKGTIKLYLPEE